MSASVRFPSIFLRAVALLCVVECTPALAVRAQEPIAVVVHPKSALADISLDALARLYLGRSTMLTNSEPVVLLETAALREPFYAKALGMNEDRFKRHWIRVVFAGETATPPRSLGSASELAQYVAAHPGAIAFVALSNVDPSLKVLSVNGVRPGDPNYVLR